jgi:hypothetical protein
MTFVKNSQMSCLALLDAYFWGYASRWQQYFSPRKWANELLNMTLRAKTRQGHV